MTLLIISLCFAFFALGIQVGVWIVMSRINKREREYRESRRNLDA